MKYYLISIMKLIIIDIVFGIIASVFVYFIAGEIIPKILTTTLMSGAISITFDKEILKQIFSIWHNFCILFGVRFVIGYISGNYSKIQ